MVKPILTPYQSQYYAWLLTRRMAGDTMESLGPTLVDSQVDLNPHQVEAALFACRNPLSKGVILADEVGLGKTIEAGLVISQRWAERKRKILIIVPANLRKQWHQELQDKFNLFATVLEAKNYNFLRKGGVSNPFNEPGPTICSYQFVRSKAEDVRRIQWDLVVIDEAHRLRNVYKTGNVIARTIKDALEHVEHKVLLTATPLQNSLLELYGLVSMIDDRVFGDLESFRSQFSQLNRQQNFQALRARIKPFCLRTLRSQVQQYVPYTARIAIVEEFTPTREEKELSDLVADYLCRPDLQALPEGQRQLISLVLWKLLASSPQAIAGAMETMADRLQKVLDGETPELSDLTDTLDEDFESLDETADEWGEDEAADGEKPNVREAVAKEIKELRHYTELARNLRENSKGKALLIALDKAFNELDRLEAPKKAIIFTESKRTQEYLLTLLKDSRYGAGIVLFNGTNTDPRSQEVYKDWLKKHDGTDRISRSKSADTRAALVEHFKEQGTVMIATEAGAEGINLQFCSLVINYDLPWNPQRIEQRIGRCHRYGQKFDVVVVNFIDRSNEADARIYHLLDQKFKLFQGVFGASDEVLGAIGSGVDFERRIAEIYRTAWRQPEAIKAAFDKLREDLSGEINETMVKTRQLLIENFDDEVQEKLRVNAADSKATLSRFEKMLMDLTRTELQAYARFDVQPEVNGFTLHTLPSSLPPSPASGRGAGGEGAIPLGKYELPRRSGDAHTYRLGHPLAEWVIDLAKHRLLNEACLTFDYAAHGSHVGALVPYRGRSGLLSLVVLTVEALGLEEQHLIAAAITEDGEILVEDMPEKLLRMPATVAPFTPQVRIASEDSSSNSVLNADIQSRRDHLLREVNQRNLGYFQQEVEKLDAWADDLKLGLEQEIKEIDRQIKEIRRTAATATTLDEKLHWQKQQRDFEGKRSKLRRELFVRQDEIEIERNRLIEQLEKQLEQKIKEQHLFNIAWDLN